MNFLSSQCVLTNSSSWICARSSETENAGSVSEANCSIRKDKIEKSEWKGRFLLKGFVHCHPWILAVGRAVGKWHLQGT